MTATVQRAQIGDRILTFVADSDPSLDPHTRVYLGASGVLVDAEPGVLAGSRFVRQPHIDIAGVVYTPQEAEEMGRRLLIAAAHIRQQCGCGHQWWEHRDGAECLAPAAGVICQCGSFNTVLQMLEVE